MTRNKRCEINSTTKLLSDAKITMSWLAHPADWHCFAVVSDGKNITEYCDGNVIHVGSNE